MRKFLIFGATASIIILSLFFLFNEDKEDTSKKNTMTQKETNIQNGIQKYSDTQYESSFIEMEPIHTYEGFKEDLLSGKTVFVWKVWELRRSCPKEMTPDKCNESILEKIGSNLSPDEKDKVISLFKNYFTYEARMRSFKSEGMSFEERYKATKKIRRSLFSEEDVNLVFGLEEREVDFIDKSSDFIERTKNMSADERVEKYFQLKKETFGSFYEGHSNREDKFNTYNTEMMLREDQLSSMGPEEKQKKTYNIYREYFGETAAKEMISNQKIQQEVEKNIQTYNAKEKEFLAKNKDMDEETKQKKLEELRIQILGEKEAENYISRKNINDFGK